ncbi:Formate/nitrite transporter FocA, FNT family [Halomicrobium zhouii]|uniref:Formate/nitrite transporter FocA, FNT family n=1 Tax=Halomicrobium zhouii TaxID=767519 RepID=A0A1I6LXG4_9EURY|nr:formate/nitrite transporter family protein [Halomicrobium zhouii]SFS08113.1 Formate/nitrite transporter FocA, FNT family [Halomicrobium zhouii]
MSAAPSPDEIFERAVDEGERRLDQSLLELVSTSFIAGFTIIFGIVALGIVEAAVHPLVPELSTLAGALAFGPGVVFLVAGRAELFNENFFDPVAKAVDADEGWLVGPLVRLWVVTFALNIVGGVVFAWFLSFEGALPTGTADALARYAEHLLRRETAGVFGSAFAGGALVSLLSFMLAAADDTGSRMALAYAVGVLLSLGPFDHVVVTALHAVFGLFFDAQVTLVSLAVTVGVVTAGNLAGGLGLVTLTHVTQVMGAREEAGENDDS